MLLILVSIAVVSHPFLRHDAEESRLRADYDIVVYRSQLAEIDKEIELGLLTPDLADAARAVVPAENKAGHRMQARSLWRKALKLAHEDDPIVAAIRERLSEAR